MIASYLTLRDTAGLYLPFSCYFKSVSGDVLISSTTEKLFVKITFKLQSHGSILLKEHISLRPFDCMWEEEEKNGGER